MLTNKTRLRKLISEYLQTLTEAAVDENEARELLKGYQKGLAKKGVDVSKIDSFPVLGTGTRGTAFDLGDKVLKVTNDEKEATAAATLKGKTFKNIVTFYDAWQFGDTPFFGVIQEKLEPLDSATGKMFNDALVATGIPLWIKRAGGDWSTVKQMTKDYMLSVLKKKFPENYNSPEAKKYAQSIQEKWTMLTREFGLKGMFEALTSEGIDFHDYHSGNLLQRPDGSLVLIDLGMSNIRGGAKVDQIYEMLLSRGKRY